MSLVDIQFAGHTFKLESADGTDQITSQIENGSYEAPLPMLMMATLLRTEGSFIDVGANTGVYSVMACTLTKGRDIIAFEPHPLILNYLKRNLECNGFLDRVEIHNIALSDASGNLSLYIPDQWHGLIETSASLEKGFQISTSSIEVEVRRLDDIPINSRIAVIKVDIEGHEYAFLNGARKTIDQSRPIIFAEVLSVAKRHLLDQFLRDANYVDFRLRLDMAIHDGNVLFDNSAWNHAFVPEERLSTFKEACDSSGIPILKRFIVV